MTNYSIEQVLPHDHPMILIDELLHYDGDSATCAVTIKPESPLYNPELNGVPSYVGIEYMAQTIAAFANANKLDEGEKVSIGFLVSSRKYTTQLKLYPNGEKFVIRVEKVLMGENGLSVFDCEIRQHDDVVVTAKINIFQPNDPEAFLAGEE